MKLTDEERNSLVILQLEKAEPEKDDNIYNIFIHYYVERGKISLNRDLYNDALRFLKPMMG